MTKAPERPERLLIVEDDTSLREGLALNFRLRGFPVVTAADGDEGLLKAFDARPDLIVLDLMLPGCSGLEILDELRSRGERVPVLVLSARGSTAEKVQGLQGGADDYLAKPFELPELLARVEALLRRERREREAEPDLVWGDVVVHVGARLVQRGGRAVALSAREFDLLCLLARSPGTTFSRETILDRVWGWGFEGTPRTVDNFVLTLRRKLEADPASPRHLVTVRQVGYRLDP
jgi:two-component system alkaline phosphatase synthesis response regulator PhoP